MHSAMGTLIALSLVLSFARAQPALAADAPGRQSDASATTSGPSWQELTPGQRLSLKPLAANWNALGPALKRNWIALAANYPMLTPAEQAKLHSRMSEWSLLSKQERARARLNFAESKKMSPDQKTASWEAYQALAPEEKKKLAASAPPKPTGAAGAAKPIAPQKLATIPLSGNTSVHSAAPQSPPKVIDSSTSLPLPTQTIEPALKTE